MPLHNTVRSLWLSLAGAMVTATLTAAPHAAAAPTAAPNAVVVVGGQRVECAPAPLLADNDVYIPADLITERLAGRVSYKPDGDTWKISLAGHELLLRTGSRHYQRDGARGSAPLAPQLVDYTLYVPLWTVSYAFELSASTVSVGGQLTITIEQPPAVVQGIRYFDHPDKLRVVIDLTAPAALSWREDGRIVAVTLPKPPKGVPAHHRYIDIHNDLVNAVMQRPTAQGATEVAVELARDLTPAVFALKDPPRIVIDVPRPGAAAANVAKLPVEEVVAPERHEAGGAVPWETRKFSTPRGPVRVNVIRINMADPRVEVRPALAGPTIMTRATAKDIAARNGAVAAVNGGFFAARGDPLGMLVIDGEWIKAPMLRRTVLGVTARHELLMDNLDFDAHATFSKTGEFKLAGLNCNHGTVDEMVLYTRRWGDHLPRDRHVVRAAIGDDGVLTMIGARGEEFPIPAGGYALSATGGMARRLAKAEIGERVTITLGTRPRWDGLVHALGGGPRLVRNGKTCITAVEERFRRDVWGKAAARTAVGIDKAGRLVLVAVDAGGPGNGRGMTLTELASTMLKLGCQNAMNLDGGSSSTFVVSGRVVNAPSSGWQRKVSNALIVLARDVAAARLPGSY